jgi:hypothetical protein
MHCDRCYKEATVTTMSYFNTDTICMDCRDREKAHPNYEQAREADNAACRQGNYNFSGIGRPSDL